MAAVRTLGYKIFTVFGIYQDDTDERYTTFVEAATQEDAEKQAVKDAPSDIFVAAVVSGKVEPLDHAGDTNLVPIRGKGYETIVANVKVSYRKIKLPYHCPKCKADLRKHEAVKQWDYWDYSWEGRIPRGEYTSDYGVAVNQDRGARTPGGMDSTVTAAVLQCNGCEHFLWNGYQEEAKPKPKKRS